MEALHRQVLPFLLRRMKEDVLQDLPPKIIQDYYCDLSPLQVSTTLLAVHFCSNHKILNLLEPLCVRVPGVLHEVIVSHEFRVVQLFRTCLNHDV